MSPSGRLVTKFPTTVLGTKCRLASPGFRLASCIQPRLSSIHNGSGSTMLGRGYHVTTPFTQEDVRKMEEAAEDMRKPSAIARRLPHPNSIISNTRFREFGLSDRVFIVTGGARGLGLTLAEALVEAGGHVYCLDRLPEPDATFQEEARKLATQFEGSLQYRRVDVQDAEDLDNVIASVAAEHGRMDGLIAAAGVQLVVPALDYPVDKIGEMLNINYTGVYLSAVSCARQMIKYKTPGAMCLIGSMSGLIANKGFTSSVYNSSKAAVVQLGRSLAMEWGVIPEFAQRQDDSVAGSRGWKRGIRVNVLCPGNIMTPMVRKNFEDDPELRALWERENMMGRISEPEEYRGATLFMLSDASSFMTGSHLVVDGGYTAW